MCREDARTRSLGESKSRNKVSVGEPAEGSLSVRFQPIVWWHTHNYHTHTSVRFTFFRGTELRVRFKVMARGATRGSPPRFFHMSPPGHTTMVSLLWLPCFCSGGGSRSRSQLVLLRRALGRRDESSYPSRPAALSSHEPPNIVRTIYGKLALAAVYLLFVRGGSRSAPPPRAYTHTPLVCDHYKSLVCCCCREPSSRVC